MQVLQQARVDAVQKSLSLFVKAPLHTRMFVYKGGLLCSSWRDETGRLFPPPRVSGVECTGRCWACWDGGGPGRAELCFTDAFPQLCVCSPSVGSRTSCAEEQRGCGLLCLSLPSPDPPPSAPIVGARRSLVLHWSRGGVFQQRSPWGCRITWRTDAEAEEAL